MTLETRRGSPGAIAPLLVAVMLAGCARDRAVAGSPPGAAGPTARSFELRPGTIVDPASGTVFVMQAEGGLAAVALADGELRWSSRQAARPLYLEGELLLAQGPPADRSPQLVLVGLDVRRPEAPRFEAVLELPPGVQATVDPRPEVSFTLEARAARGDLYVIWSQVTETPQAPPRRESGAVRIDAMTGHLTPIDPAALPLPAQAEMPGTVRLWAAAHPSSRPPRRVGDLWAAVEPVGLGQPEGLRLHRWRAAGEPLEETPVFEGTFLLTSFSSDGKHLLVSQGDASETRESARSYEWSIVSLQSGERLGRSRQSFSSAPFCVVRDLLLFEAAPQGRLRAGEWVETPLRLIAQELDSEELRWSLEIRDRAYRGPLPPAR